MMDGALARHAERLRAERVPFVQATVVRVEHPASMRAGDAALIEPDGAIDGFVGGVCAQASVRLHAARALETGEPLLLRIVPEEVGAAAGEPAEGTAVARNPCLSGGALDVFLEPCLPAPRMAVIGEAPIARALGALARTAGWDVALLPAEDAERARPRPGESAFVVAAHGAGAEERALAAALREDVPYVALVASPRRGEAVLDALDAAPELRARVHVPAGLAIGARTPAEVAIAILAQLVAARHAAPEGVPEASTAPAAPAAEAPATAIDPVCGMEVLAVPATPHLDVGGERVWFCSEGCRAAFAARRAGDDAGAAR